MMTRIDLAKDGDEFSILIQGHAGYANPGNDIVCAAVSILPQSLIKYMEDHDIECNYKVSSGYLWVYGKGCIEAFDVIKSGMELIEANYPQHVEVTKGCTIFRDINCD